MNYQTKLANAVNDYQLGLKVADLSLAGLDDIPGMIPGTEPSLKSKLTAPLAPDAREMYNYIRDVSSSSPSHPPISRGAALREVLPGAARELAGHRGVQTAGALAGLGGLGAAGVAGVNAYKRHKRNQMLKQLAMGGGGAAALLGGGLLARHLSRDED
jgi:hypothetical protein